MSIRSDVEVTTFFTIDQGLSDSKQSDLTINPFGHFDTLEEAQIALPALEKRSNDLIGALGIDITTNYGIIKVTQTVVQTTERMPAL